MPINFRISNIIPQMQRTPCAALRRRNSPQQRASALRVTLSLSLRSASRPIRAPAVPQRPQQQAPRDCTSWLRPPKFHTWHCDLVRYCRRLYRPVKYGVSFRPLCCWVDQEASGKCDDRGQHLARELNRDLLSPSHEAKCSRPVIRCSYG